MPPKGGGNVKKESGRAKKAENELKKKEVANAEKERQEASKWDDGTKVDKAAEARAKAEAAAARKAEAARILAEEEAQASVSKPKPPKASKSKKGAAPTVGESSGKGKGKAEPEPEPEIEVAGPSNPGGNLDGIVESFSASNLDDALDMLEVVNAKTDKASVGNMASGIEKHPERRFKASFEAYCERELPELKKDRPGLRLQQYKDLLFKQFQKSDENPFNQTTVSYDATKEEKVEVLKRRQAEVEERLREKKGLGSP